MNGVNGGDPSVLLLVEQLGRPVPGGIGTYCRGLLGGLASLAADLAAEPADPAGPGVPRVTLLAGREAAGALRALPFPSRPSGLPTRVLTAVWGRGALRAPDGFDVVHATSLAQPPGRPGQRRVVTVHDLTWRRHPEATTARGRRWHEAALRRALTVADGLVVPSEQVAADLRAAGAAGERIAVVPHGVDHLDPPDHEGAAALLGRLGVAGPYLLTVGTLEPRKNLAGLLRAYAVARPRLPDPWPLVVVGPRGWGADATGPLPPGAVLAGPVVGGTLTALYAGARAFAYLPLDEGYGLPPLEAMSQGVPVVAARRVPSVGAAACTVDPLDAGGAADALVALSTDGPERRRRVAEGLTLAAGRTWRASARRHAEVWEGR